MIKRSLRINFLKEFSKKGYNFSKVSEVLKDTPNIHEVPYMNKTETFEKILSSTKLKEHIKKLMKKNGSMSFTKFMEECLTNKDHGYYMKQDVFNKTGDFVTSPEISQMFGECVGIWLVHFLSKIGILDQNLKNEGFDLQEFGPGRGTLMKDVLRTLSQFKLLYNFRIHYIEASPFLRKIQMETTQEYFKQHGIYFEYYTSNDPQGQQRSEIFLNEEQKIQLSWYSTYEDYISDNFKDLVTGNILNKNKTSMQQRPVVILCNEIFDALPVAIFENTKYGWCEKLVGLSPLADGSHTQDKDFQDKAKNYFQWEHGIPNSDSVKKLLNPEKLFNNSHVKEKLQIGDTIEIAPKSLIMMNSFAELINKTGGALQAIDYGDWNAFSSSLRGISNHKFVPHDSIQEMPGEIDLSAYVSFQALAEAAGKVNNISVGNQITQGYFLEAMGITQRLEVLLQGCKNKDQRDKLESSYQRLTHSDYMGQVFKVLYIGKEEYGQIYPFENLDRSSQVFY